MPVDAKCIWTACNTTFLAFAFHVKGNDCLPLLGLVVTNIHLIDKLHVMLLPVCVCQRDQ